MEGLYSLREQRVPSFRMGNVTGSQISLLWPLSGKTSLVGTYFARFMLASSRSVRQGTILNADFWIPTRVLGARTSGKLKMATIGLRQSSHSLSVLYDACNDGSRPLGDTDFSAKDTTPKSSASSLVHYVDSGEDRSFQDGGQQFFCQEEAEALGVGPQYGGDGEAPGSPRAAVMLAVRKVEIADDMHATPPAGQTVEVEALENWLAYKLGQEAAPFTAELLDQVAGSASKLPTKIWAFCSSADAFALAHFAKRQVVGAERAIVEVGTLVTELERVQETNRDLGTANETLRTELTNAKFQIEGLLQANRQLEEESARQSRLI
uniref:Uncharacterized protein n=1 Tax=Cannabis sativa TaxID=3483 RepID=A0A803NK91_CANSA